MAPASSSSQPSGPRRDDTDDPRRARTRALKILFQADVRGSDPVQLLDALDGDAAARQMLDDVDDLADDRAPVVPTRRRDADASGGDAPPLDDFTRTLVTGVARHRDDVDALISRYARRWQIPRMPVVDRTALRLGTYELLHEPTPAAVVIDEAVQLAKAMSTDDSGRYVNGVLESIRKDVAARGSQRPSA